jgi:membrane protein
MLKETVIEWIDDDAMTWAAAVACYTLLALAPLLVIAMKVLTVVLHKRAATQQLQSQVVSWMGPATANAFNEIIEKVSRSGAGTVSTIISLVLIVVSVGGVFAELQHAMNRIWKVKPKPGQALWGFLRARVLSLLILVVATGLMFASVAVTAWIQHLSATLGIGWKSITWAIDISVSLGVLTLLFALLYRTVPDARIDWQATWVGALITAVLFELGRYGVAGYFRYAAPASAFGALGSFAAVLIWIYYSYMIVFFGAEFTQVYAKARGLGVKPSKHAEALKECDETETATPSSAEPGEKPQRPGWRPGQSAVEPSYGDVLSRYVSSHPADCVAQGGSRTTAVLIGAFGLATGTLIGAFAAARAGFFQTPSRADIRSATIRQRLRRAERQVSRAARINRFLEADGVEKRVEALAQRVRQAQGRPADTWISRIARVAKSQFSRLT